MLGIAINMGTPPLVSSRLEGFTPSVVKTPQLSKPLGCQPYRAKFQNLYATIDFWTLFRLLVTIQPCGALSYVALFPLADSRAPQSSAAYACPALTPSLL